MRNIRPNTKIQTIDLERNTSKVWDAFPGRLATEFADGEHVDVLKTALSGRGPEYWNDWRIAHPSIQPNLARIEFAVGETNSGQPVGVNLSRYDMSEANLNQCSLAFAQLSGAKFFKATLRESLINQSQLIETDFTRADLTQASMSVVRCVNSQFIAADLSRALLHASTLFTCNFNEADLESAVLDSAMLNGSSLRGARLWSVRFSQANLSACDLTAADLSHAHMVKTDLSGADLTDARVYGISCWDALINGDTVQRDLKISSSHNATISVDDIRVAQFIHLILTNENIRTVLDTISRRAVLLLGRFGGGGLDVLRAIGAELRKADYLPMIFEFSRPQDRTYTETVRTLAGLSRFVVVDLSGPSVPQELFATVPNLKIPVVPVLEKGRRSYSMFSDLLEYDWVLRPIVEFTTTSDLIANVPRMVIEPAEQRVAERQARLNEIFGA